VRAARYLPRPLRATLRQWQADTRLAWIRHFHAFSAAELQASLRRLGVMPGDVLMVHASYGSFAGFRGNVGDALRTLQRAVTEDGALLMPTLPFSGSAVEFVENVAVTDLKRAPSHMGLLSDLFRRWPNVTRSIHPTHPVAGWGRRAAALLNEHAVAGSPCGVHSPYHKLLEADGKILLAGVSIAALTFYHSIEELLEPLLPVRPFTERIYELKTLDARGALHLTRTRLYDPTVSARRYGEPMIDPLKQRGYWRETHVGRLSLVLLHAREVLETVESMARAGVFCYRP
jgi:aminoglycoside 3-N-acetyltransferase